MTLPSSTPPPSSHSLAPEVRSGDTTDRTTAAASSSLRASITSALTRLGPMIASGKTSAFRLLSNAVDSPAGIDVDIYDRAAVMNIHEAAAPANINHSAIAGVALEALAPLNITAIYIKPFARDRSRLGGQLPPEVTDPNPAAGVPAPESLTIREHDWLLEVRLYDGLSTGLFLDQRDNRKFVHQWCGARTGERGSPPISVLNTFAYTCAFSVAAASAGALTTSVDVSGRYLDWGKRNFTLNGLDIAEHRFAKMDTFEFITYAQRKSLRYDLIILDPPSFGSGNKKRGHKPWSSLDHYARLVREAATLLNPRGVILASTNTRELCNNNRLRYEVAKGLNREPRWLTLPPPPSDFARDRGRFSACAFELPSGMNASPQRRTKSTQTPP